MDGLGRPGITMLEARMELSRQRARKRRLVLVEAGYSTYILTTRNQMPAILCLCCGMTSNHKGDIENRYCGFCKSDQSEWTAQE